jgi:peptidoglycan/xylan/chitin deacetylase (PgdA/CDA1 family)
MKELFLKYRKRLLPLAALLGALALAVLILGAPFGDVATVMGGYELQPVRAVEREDSLAALSFNLGAEDAASEKLLELLKRFDIQATFFATAGWMEQNGDSIRRINEMGHDFGCLGQTAPYGAAPEGEQHESLTELQKFNDAYYKITGKRSALYRPQNGYDNEMLSALYETGITPVEQSVDMEAWREQGNSAVIKNTKLRLKSGCIVLGYIDEKELELYLTPVLEYASAQGLRLLGIGAILDCDGCYVDFKGTLRPKG